MKTVQKQLNLKIKQTISKNLVRQKQEIITNNIIK